MDFQRVFFWLLLAVAFPSLAVTVPEEAQRHMVRGTAAVEMAQGQGDLTLALEEFRRAADIAPNWPNPYYNLGLIQERLGKFGDAARSFRRYLELAPGAPDASSVRELVYKLEFKAEQTLTTRDIIETLTAGFSVDTSRWRVVTSAPCGRDWSMQERLFRADGNEAVRVLAATRYYPNQETYQRLAIDGPKVKYTVILNLCDSAANRDLGNCDSVVEHEVEVVSKRRVHARQVVIRQGAAGGTAATGQRFSCTYERK